MINAIDVIKKLVDVQGERINDTKPFRLAQVKRYCEPEILVNSFFSKLRHVFSSFTTPVDE